MPLDLPPYVFALTAAFLFALGGQLQSIGMAHINSRNGTAIGIATSAACFWLAAPWYLDVSHFGHWAALLFVGMGLIRPAVSANLGVAGIRYLGPTLGMTLSSISPFFGIALGVLWLGEDLTWAVVLGTAGIVAAVVMLSRKGAAVAGGWPVWALALPIGAAAIRATGHTVNKFGMIHIPDPYFATLMGFTTSAVVTVALQSIRKEGGTASDDGAEGLSLRGPGARWFMIGGIMFCVAVLSLNTALMTGEVVTVVPIVASSPMFALLLSVFVFRRETITLRTLLALALILPSVIAVALWG
ncbi:MAG: DMT family transporter [Rhodospirillaceae bacterium]